MIREVNRITEATIGAAIDVHHEICVIVVIGLLCISNKNLKSLWGCIPRPLGRLRPLEIPRCLRRGSSF